MKKDTKVKSDKKEKKKSKKKIIKELLIAFVILLVLGIASGLFLLYGPWSGFRDWLITTAMSSMRHQYLATWFYDDKTIQECLDKNKVVEVSGETDENAVEIVDYEEKETITYANEYERQILEKDEKNNQHGACTAHDIELCGSSLICGGFRRNRKNTFERCKL